VLVLTAVLALAALLAPSLASGQLGMLNPSVLGYVNPHPH